MNHNKHNLKRGQTVILDKDAATECEVKIVDFTPNEMFATVGWYGNTDTWEVMTVRLSPKPPYIPETEDEAKFLENDSRLNNQ